MELVERVGGVSIAGDDDVTSGVGESCLVGTSVAFVWLYNDGGAFLGCDVTGVVCGVTVDDDNLEVPAVVFKGLRGDGVDSFSDAGFFVEGRDDDADFQDMFLRVWTLIH